MKKNNTFVNEKRRLLQKPSMLVVPFIAVFTFVTLYLFSQDVVAQFDGNFITQRDQDTQYVTTTLNTSFGRAVADEAARYIEGFNDPGKDKCGVFVGEVYNNIGIPIPVGQLTGHTKDWCDQADIVFNDDWNVLDSNDRTITESDIQLGDILLYGRKYDGYEKVDGSICTKQAFDRGECSEVSCAINYANSGCKYNRTGNWEQCSQCPGHYLISKNAAWRGHAGIVGMLPGEQSPQGVVPGGSYYDYQQDEIIAFNGVNKPVQCRIRYVGPERDRFGELDPDPTDTIESPTDSPENTPGDESGNNSGNNDDGEDEERNPDEDDESTGVGSSLEAGVSDIGAAVGNIALLLFGGVGGDESGEESSETGGGGRNREYDPTNEDFCVDESIHREYINTEIDLEDEYSLTDWNDGYLPMLELLRQNDWAVRRLLAYEKKLLLEEDLNTILPYLNTAWIWFENDQTGLTLPPDLYFYNCNQEHWDTSQFCPGGLLQVGGYQAQEKKGAFYRQIYRACHGDTAPSTVMQEVFENSVNTTRPLGPVYRWNYKELEGQGLTTTSIDGITQLSQLDYNDIFSSEENQYRLVLLGKDPCMVAGFNSTAVVNLPRDILLAEQAIANNEAHWATYVVPNKQNIANMVKALQEFDKESPSICGTPEDEDGGNSGTPISFENFQGFCQWNPLWEIGRDTPTSTCTPFKNYICGPTSEANIACALKEGEDCKTPTQVTNAAYRLGFWNCGMLNMHGFLASDYTKNELGIELAGPNISWPIGTPINVAAAKQYLDNGNLIICSSTPRNHIYVVKGIRDNTLITWDSGFGCNENGTGLVDKEFPASDCDRYAYAVRLR